MQKMFLSFVAMVLLAQQSQAINAGTQLLVNSETKANAVSTRENRPILMPHFEIPLDAISIDFAKRLSPAIREQLIFQSGKQTMVRWILNPEDTVWYLKVQEYFASRGINLKKKFYFIGYQTASRSYIVENPEKTVQFSVKSSTDVTGGHWANKQQPVGEAIDSRLNADFLAEIQNKLSFKNIVIMDEPAILKLAAIDQAVVIRDLADLNHPETGFSYVPGFSVLHEDLGRKLALHNGSKDPYAYWTENYVKPVGRALGEFAARTGMQFDSPHSQNFLVELDQNMKPTGRIVLRDLADLYIYKDLIETLHPDSKTYLQQFTQKDNVRSDIAAGFGPLHGNKSPTWISDADYSKWNSVFFAEFERTFTEISGLQLTDFKMSNGMQRMRYFGNNYHIAKTSESATNFWKNMKQVGTPKGILNCSFVL